MIPLIDLKAQYRSIKDELDAAVLGVLASGEYTLGREVGIMHSAATGYFRGSPEKEKQGRYLS
jgi:hypothetical protein